MFIPVVVSVLGVYIVWCCRLIPRYRKTAASIITVELLKLGPDPWTLMMEAACFYETFIRLGDYLLAKSTRLNASKIWVLTCMAIVPCSYDFISYFRQESNFAGSEGDVWNTPVGTVCAEHWIRSWEKRAVVLETGHFSVAVQRTCTSGLRAVAIHADARGPTVRRKQVVFQSLRKTYFVHVILSFRCTISPRQLKLNGLRWRRRRHVPSKRPVLGHPSLPSSLNARDQVLHPYKIKCEIIGLCILVLAYLDKEDERFWNEWL